MGGANWLLDLPERCLHLATCSLTPTAAARLRTTCTGLQQVVDAAWEPWEEPVPPHKRSVPLSLEQVKAQMPRRVPAPVPLDLPDESASDDFDITPARAGHKLDHGRPLHFLAMYGPALTRLTANVAVNVLEEQQLVVCLCDSSTQVTTHSSVRARVGELGLMTLREREMTWPPLEPTDILGEFAVHAVFHTAAGALLEPGGVDMHINGTLLVTDDTSVRDASAEEWQKFLEGAEATGAADAGSFDVYLSESWDEQEVCVFLQPFTPTLRLVSTAAL